MLLANPDNTGTGSHGYATADESMRMLHAMHCLQMPEMSSGLK